MVQYNLHGATPLHDDAHDNAFWGQFKSWHRFRFIFFKATTPLLSSKKFVTTTTMTNPGEFKYVR